MKCNSASKVLVIGAISFVIMTTLAYIVAFGVQSNSQILNNDSDAKSFTAEE